MIGDSAATQARRSILVTPHASLLRIRAGVLLGVTGAIIFVATSLYGFGAPFTYGHYGYHAGEYATRARHTLRQGALLPGNIPGSGMPTPGSYYLHHPILTHHLVAVAFATCGDRETSVRLAALVYSAATLAALALFARRMFGSTLGGLSVLLFAVVPFNIWYADHIDHGYPGLIFVLMALHGYGKWLENGRWGDGARTLGAVAVAGCFDWTPFFFFVPWGVHIAATALARKGRYLSFLPFFILAALVPVAIHVLAVTAAHQWPDVLTAYRTRSASTPIGPFLRTMSIYGRDLFGYPLLLMTTLGFSLAVARLSRGVGGVRALALVSLVVAMVLHLCIFREEVVTHAYRLIYFSPAVVLATVDVIASVVGAASATKSALVAKSLGAALAVTIVAATLPTTWRGLIESRAHGGIPNWVTMDPRLPRSVVARELRDRSRLGDRLYLHGSFPFRMELGFYLDRDFVPGATADTVDRLPQLEKRRALFVFAPSALAAGERTIVDALISGHPFTRIGPYGILDLRAVGPSKTAFSVASRRPSSLWQRYWLGPYPWPEVIADVRPPSWDDSARP